MSYKLIYTRSAERDIHKLDTVVKKKLQKKLEEYSSSPLAHARRLTNSVIGSYRWRVGNYRVVFDIRGRTIVVLRVGQRREIYR